MDAPSKRGATLNDAAWVGQTSCGVHAIHEARQAVNGSAREQAVAAGRMHGGGALGAKSIGCTANGTAGGDHVVNDGHDLAVHVQIFRLVDDGARVDARLLQVGKSAADGLGHGRGPVDGTFVW